MAGETIRDAVRAGVSAYVVDGLDPKRIKPIVEVARAVSRIRRPCAANWTKFRRSSPTAKLVDKAKGVLMKARGLDEDAAYHAMRKLAMERGQTMAGWRATSSTWPGAALRRVRRRPACPALQ